MENVKTGVHYSVRAGLKNGLELAFCFNEELKLSVKNFLFGGDRKNYVDVLLKVNPANLEKKFGRDEKLLFAAKKLFVDSVGR